MAVTTAASPSGARIEGAGLLWRIAAAVALLVVVAAMPLITGDLWDRRIALMAIYAIIGLSVNIITGYAGQISLGHQAFVGIGAFASAYIVGPHIGAGFVVGFVGAGVLGAFLAFALGLVSLRVKGLYFALVTLAFGLMAETTIFNWRAFTGGGAGAPDPRPAGFVSDQSYAFLCMLVLGVFLYVDWRMSKSKPGRAVVAVRNNEIVASTLGINVATYKLLAFAVGGFLAGVAGALYASFTGQAYANSFTFPDPALVWLLMAVVGGLGSRAGVVIGSAFFAVFPQLFPTKPLNVPGWLHFLGVKTVVLSSTMGPLIGALLLLVTVTLYPGGIGQQLLPIRRWMAGGPFREEKHSRFDEPSPLEAVAAELQTPVAPSASAPAASPAPGPAAPIEERPPPEPQPEPEPEPEPEPQPQPEPEPAAESEPAAPAGDGDGDADQDDQQQRETLRSRLFGFRKRREGGE